METRAIRNYNIAFVLNEKSLEYLCSAIADELPRLRFDAECSDCRKRSFGTLEELKKYPNLRSQAIENLTVVASNQGGKDVLFVILRAEGDDNVHLSTRGDEAMTSCIEQRIVKFLDDTRPWYWFLALWNIDSAFLYLFNGSLAVFALSLALMRDAVVNHVESIQWPAEWIPYLKFTVFAFGGWALGYIPFALINFLRYLQKRFYPRGVFAWGGGLQRYKDADAY